MIMTEYTISSGNIFEDLGFANAEEKLAKVKLASVIYDLITEQELSEQEVSQILGIDEAKISNLKNGRLQKFSLEQMFDFLVALGQKIEILVTPQALANSSLSIQVMYRLNLTKVIMNIQLKPNQEQFIQKQLKSGRFNSSEQVIDTAFYLLEILDEDYLQWVEETRQKIDVAIAELDNGEGLDGEKVINDILEKFKKAQQK